MNPTFDTGVDSYTARTSNATNKVTAKAVENDAHVEIRLTNTNGSTTVSNGTAAAWATGENVLSITVTDQDGGKAEYSVTVTKS